MRAEVMASPSPVPRAAGVYGWWFREVPPGVPTEGCLTHGGLTLLYVGIAPKETRHGRPSRQTLYHRIRYHYRGNAEGSTLRLTLGCLLGERLGIQLRRVGSGKRMTFGEGEQVLSAWMAENAFVSWVVTEEPWRVEAGVIRTTCVPLNLDQNRAHPFHAALSAMRHEAKARASGTPP